MRQGTLIDYDYDYEHEHENARATGDHDRSSRSFARAEGHGVQGPPWLVPWQRHPPGGGAIRELHGNCNNLPMRPPGAMDRSEKETRSIRTRALNDFGNSPIKRSDMERKKTMNAGKMRAITGIW